MSRWIITRVKVVYPWEYTGSATDRESVLRKFEELTFRTETWMNEQYKIDYRVEQVEGKRWMHGASAQGKSGFELSVSGSSSTSMPRFFPKFPPAGRSKRLPVPRRANLPAIPIEPSVAPGPEAKPVLNPRIALGVGLAIIFVAGIIVRFQETQIHAAGAGRAG